MIGSLDPSIREVTIIGGGIAGLLAAHRLSKLGYRVILHEKNNRLGGLLRTDRFPEGIAEHAAHSLLASEPVDRLFKELQIPLLEVGRGSKARYIFNDGKRKRFPLRPFDVLQLLKKALFTRAGETPGTLAEWADAHVGTAALERLIAPFALGIFGARPDELLLQDAFPKLVLPRGRTLAGEFLRRKIQALGSKETPARPRLVVPRGGMGSVIDALEKTLRSHPLVEIHTGSEIKSLPESGNLVVATDARSAARLLGASQPELSSLLAAAPHSPLLSVTVFVESGALQDPIRGVGVLVPEGEKTRALGILFNSSAFEGRVTRDGFSSFTVLFGGTRDPSAFEWSDEEVAAKTRSALETLVGLREKAQILRLLPHRYSHAIPIYGPALRAARKEAERVYATQPGTILFANWTGSVSIRGMIETLDILS